MPRIAQVYDMSIKCPCSISVPGKTWQCRPPLCLQKYEPYSKPATFKEYIKDALASNPDLGYKRLHAILQASSCYHFLCSFFVLLFMCCCYRCCCQWWCYAGGVSVLHALHSLCTALCSSKCQAPRLLGLFCATPS